MQLRAGATASEDELLDECAKHIARYKLPEGRSCSATRSCAARAARPTTAGRRSRRRGLSGKRPADQRDDVRQEGAVRRFEGKVALVTGAAAGIGRATAERLASEGASLACVDLSLEGLGQETAKRCAELGAAVETVRCDVADPAQVEAAVRACVARFGRLDALVNIAHPLPRPHPRSSPRALEPGADGEPDGDLPHLPCGPAPPPRVEAAPSSIPRRRRRSRGCRRRRRTARPRRASWP